MAVEGWTRYPGWINVSDHRISMPSGNPPSKPTSPKTTSHGPSCCESVGSTMIGHFVTRLEVEAGKAGGSLDAAQIRALAQRFIATEQARFKGFYQRSWDECTILRESHLLEGARKMPFDRVLMRRFAHLFPPRTGDDGGTGILSRRIIPGFNVAIDKMIGPALYQHCQTRCEVIVDRHALGDGGWNWEAIHADLDAKLLVNEALVVVAGTFSSFAKRRAWFLEMVNAHLTPVRRGASDEHFRLGESGFSALMRALFADLAASLRIDPDGARSRWGAATVEELREFFRHLDSA